MVLDITLDPYQQWTYKVGPRSLPDRERRKWLGELVVTSSADQSVEVWDLVTGLPLRVWAGHDDDVMSVAVNADFTRMITGCADGTVNVWDPVSQNPPRVLAFL